MATFSINVVAYEIIACSQIESDTHSVTSNADIDSKGNGNVELFAYNLEGAMKLAKDFLAIYKETNS